MNERGLSTVVSTIVLVLLVLVAIGGVWMAISNLLNEGANSVSLGDLSVDLVIRSATVNTTTGLALIKVARNPGIADVTLTAIKFVVEDSRNAEVFEVQTGDFPEYAQRTFELNLNERELLNINDIKKISLAPVYLSGSGEMKTGSLGSGSFTFTDSSSSGSFLSTECSTATDCGTDYWITGTEICSSLDPKVILQYKKIYACTGGFCQESVQPLAVETCAETEECYSGECQSQGIPCTSATVGEDCGVDGFIGFPICASNAYPEKIIQDFQNFECVNSFCTVSVTSETVSECPEEQVCEIVQGQPECFVPLECNLNGDCPVGEVCNSGNCETELAVMTGAVASIWPFDLGEYFDSPELSKVGGENYKSYTIFFPGSAESRCLKIDEYVYPESLENNAYVRLNESETQIDSGDNFEIWETEYGCTNL